jgi:hypothetical protein
LVGGGKCLSQFCQAQVGHFLRAPKREGEVVAVTYQGHVYQLSERNTGKSREDMEAFLEPLDRRHLLGVEATKEIQNRARHDRNEVHWPTTPEPQERQFEIRKTNDLGFLSQYFHAHPLLLTSILRFVDENERKPAGDSVTNPPSARQEV